MAKLLCRMNGTDIREGDFVPPCANYDPKKFDMQVRTAFAQGKYNGFLYTAYGFNSDSQALYGEILGHAMGSVWERIGKIPLTEMDRILSEALEIVNV